MKSIELPEYVYKYVTWGNGYHKKIISNNEIFFASSRKFNDPFDSTVPFRYDLGNYEQVLKLYIEHIHHDNPHLPLNEVQRMAKNELKTNDIRDPERIKYNINTQREYIATKFGIFSVSNKKDSILMWSHYSNMHKGICIRFNCKKLREFIENECVKNGLFIYWNNVDYKKEYPIMNPFNYDDAEVYLKSLLVKSDEWKYESELRFILFDQPNKTIILPEGIIDQIILGCRISTDNENELIKISKKKNIELIQSVLNQMSFSLEFHKKTYIKPIKRMPFFSKASFYFYRFVDKIELFLKNGSFKKHFTK